MTTQEARKEAKKLLKKTKGEALTMRSCWNCNAAHEHLKDSDFVIVCFQCGNYYYKGINVTEA